MWRRGRAGLRDARGQLQPKGLSETGFAGLVKNQRDLKVKEGDCWEAKKGRRGDDIISARTAHGDIDIRASGRKVQRQTRQR
jgi:hypothetical protein